MEIDKRTPALPGLVSTRRLGTGRAQQPIQHDPTMPQFRQSLLGTSCAQPTKLATTQDGNQQAGAGSGSNDRGPDAEYDRIGERVASADRAAGDPRTMVAATVEESVAGQSGERRPRRDNWPPHPWRYRVDRGKGAAPTAQYIIPVEFSVRHYLPVSGGRESVDFSAAISQIGLNRAICTSRNPPTGTHAPRCARQ